MSSTKISHRQSEFKDFWEELGYLSTIRPINMKLLFGSGMYKPIRAIFLIQLLNFQSDIRSITAGSREKNRTKLGET